MSPRYRRGLSNRRSATTSPYYPNHHLEPLFYSLDSYHKQLLLDNEASCIDIFDCGSSFQSPNAYEGTTLATQTINSIQGILFLYFITDREYFEQIPILEGFVRKVGGFFAGGFSGGEEWSGLGEGSVESRLEIPSILTPCYHWFELSMSTFFIWI